MDSRRHCQEQSEPIRLILFNGPMKAAGLAERARGWWSGLDPRGRRLAAIAGLAVAIGGAVWMAASAAGFFSASPSPEAARFYQEGVGALRDGTYYRASRALERATALDDRFRQARARSSRLLLADQIAQDLEKLQRGLNTGSPRWTVVLNGAGEKDQTSVAGFARQCSIGPPPQQILRESRHFDGEERGD